MSYVRTEATRATYPQTSRVYLIDRRTVRVLAAGIAATLALNVATLAVVAWASCLGPFGC